MAIGDQIFKFGVRVPKKLKESGTIIPQEIRKANQDASTLLINNVRREIELSGAVASRDMLNAVASRQVRSDTVNAWFSKAIYFKAPASRYWKYVNTRKNAGKAPFHEVSGKLQPLPHVIRWLRLKGVPVSRWFVVTRGMAKAFTGYRFVEKAIRASRPRIRELAKLGVQRAKQRMGLS